MPNRLAVLAATVAAAGTFVTGGAEVAGAAPATAPPATAASCVRTFATPDPNASPFGITAGPGGTWYADGSTIDVIHSGRTTTFPVPDPDTANIGWLTWDGRSTVWFADRGNGRIGSIARDGAIDEVQIPDGYHGTAVPQSLVLGPGDVVWFTDQVNNRIGRYDETTGQFAFYRVPSENPLGMVRGGNGDLVFTERSVDKVAEFDPTAGTFQEWSLPEGAFPNRLAVVADGMVWFTTLFDSAVWHIAGGQLHEYDLSGGPVGITYWHGNLYTALYLAGAVGEVSSTGTLTRTVTLPDAANARPLQIAGSHGYLWTTGSTDVYRVDPNC